MTKTINQNCLCENCGNEADMELTCSFDEWEKAMKAKEQKKKDTSVEDKKVKGTGTCSNCGSEADMWIDF